jgi:hypothetical protein
MENKMIEKIKKTQGTIKFYMKLFIVLDFIFRVIQRVTSFPIVLVLTLLMYLKAWIFFNIHALIFGSEIIRYSKAVNPDTFGVIINSLSTVNKKETLITQEENLVCQQPICGNCKFFEQGDTNSFCGNPKQRNNRLKKYAYYSDGCNLFNYGLSNSRSEYVKTKKL